QFSSQVSPRRERTVLQRLPLQKKLRRSAQEKHRISHRTSKRRSSVRQNLRQTNPVRKVLTAWPSSASILETGASVPPASIVGWLAIQSCLIRLCKGAGLSLRLRHKCQTGA